MEFSFVIPVYNEADNPVVLNDELKAVISRLEEPCREGRFSSFGSIQAFKMGGKDLCFLKYDFANH